MNWNDLSILITAGTGSFGNKFIELLMTKYRPRRIIIFSRDELKQLEMRSLINSNDKTQIQYFIGDVRDRNRLYHAFKGVDVVIHAATLKQVSNAEYNPIEVINTNIMGMANIIDAAIDCGVKKVVSRSADEATNPVNLYDATKICADMLCSSAGVNGTWPNTIFCVVRLGNMMCSRESVVPFLKKQTATGTLTVCDPKMIRFCITLHQAAEFVAKAVTLMQGDEIFIPKLPSMKIIDLAEAVATNSEIDFMGIKPGEKIHEILLTEDEARKNITYLLSG